jgi:hypothetical protein
MDPPLVNALEVIAVAAEVALTVGKANCAFAPTMFTKFVPLYTCNSPLVPQSEHHKISPASGEMMVDFWAKVNRGKSKPFDVEVMSNTAAEEGLVVPMATVPVNTGEAIGAFNKMAFVLAVMLAVLAVTLFVKTNSAALAVVASVVMAVEFAVMLAVLAVTIVVNVTKSAALAFKTKPGMVGAAAVPAKSPAN